jgi:kynurenine formamidase
MWIDLSVLVSPAASQEASGNERMVSFGHLGTHFDVMNKEFPLHLLRRPGVVLDVSGAGQAEVDLGQVDLAQVEAGAFVAFHSGFSAACPYGSREYFQAHPQLSHGLIDALLERGVAMIGVDFAGVRRGAEHTPKDQYCADRGVFIVENLCNLERVLDGARVARCLIHTFPVRFGGMSGLPCRVVAEV